MAALDWHGWLTIGVVLATLALLLWERFTPSVTTPEPSGLTWMRTLKSTTRL